MIFNLQQPQCFSEIGRRDNQEDYIWPHPTETTTQQRVFVLCDGVGGADKGEVASKTAATTIGEYITTHWPDNAPLSRQTFEEALAAAYKALDDAEPEAERHSRRKMGTTMTCVALHRGGALVAHIGDSRIYHVRPSLATPDQPELAIVYQSRDHSLVNELLRAGEITEEEAVNYPHKNVITRAMQPHLERPHRADVMFIDDVRGGDYFFLCSDGVLEQVSNRQLCSILADAQRDNGAKLAAIKGLCLGQTHDNATCWLVPIESVTLEEGDTTPCLDPTAAPASTKTALHHATNSAAKAKEDMEEIEDTQQMNEADNDTAQHGRKGVLAKIGRCFKAIGAFFARIGRWIKDRVTRTRLWKMLSKTNRWHWILGAIAFLCVYDSVLYFVGDSAYSVIFPTPTPKDSIITEDVPMPLVPQIEEAEEAKNKLEEPTDDKGKAVAVDPTGAPVTPLPDPPMEPTTVTTEDLNGAPAAEPSASETAPASRPLEPAKKIEAPATPADPAQ